MKNILILLMGFTINKLVIATGSFVYKTQPQNKTFDFIGKWYLKKGINDGIGFDKKNWECNVNNTPYTIEFNIDSCFILFVRNSDTIYGMWSFDSTDKAITIKSSNKNTRCNTTNKNGSRFEKFYFEGSYLVSTVYGRDSKTINFYEKIK